MLETVRRKEEKNCKWIGLVQPKSSSAWHTGQPPVRQASLRWTGHSREKSAAYGYNSPDCPVVHWTVRWANGRQRNDRPRNPRARRGPRQRSAGAPDWPVCTGQCPVRQLVRRCNGHLHQKRKEIRTGLSTVTVRWCTGLSGAPPDRRQLWPSLLASNGS
jgi:hypothetical protein